MTMDAEILDSGLSTALANVISDYDTGADANAAIYSTDNLTDLDIDTDTDTFLTTYTADHAAYWNGIYTAASSDTTTHPVQDAIRGFVEDVSASALEQQKNFALVVNTAIKDAVAVSGTIEQAVVAYLDGQPVGLYYEKATGNFILSTTTPSSTYYIPAGEYLMGAGKAVEAWAIYETFKDTIHDAYNATLGDEQAPFDAVKDYLVAASATLVGGAVTGESGVENPTVQAALFALFGTAGGVTAEQLTSDISATIHDAKVNGLTEDQTLAAVQDQIKSEINANWSAAGSTATALLDQAGDLATDTYIAVNGLVQGPDAPYWAPAAPIPAPIAGCLAPWADAPIQTSPLVIDLSSGHTGITLTTYNASTTTSFFDLDSTGFAEQTAWVSGTTGLLVRDLNSNGTIDNGNELFGSPTVDGFAKLAALDSNHDLKIDSSDSAWSSLQVWVDSNGDGVTESGELHSLASLGITSIDLAGVTPSTSTVDGNPISHTSTVTFTGGATAAIADVWFTHSTVDTSDTNSYTLDPETLFLPDLRGYGTLPELTNSMSQDSTLKGLVEDFAGSFSLASFADPTTLDSDITNILYRWAGVDGVDPSSRGIYIDAQQLEFLEHLFGQTFQYVSTPGPLGADPGPDAAAAIDTSWQGIFDNFKADILLQAGASSLFDSPVTYDPSTGTIDGTIHLSETAISTLASSAPGTESGAEAFWVSVADFIDHTEGISSLTTDEQSWLDSAVTSTTTVAWSDIVNFYDGSHPGISLDGTSGGDTLGGGDGDDYLNGGAGNDTINGYGGNDTIVDGDGNNVIYGGDGNDSITAGSGNNEIHGGAGNDLIWANNGTNVIYGDDGNDEIHTGTGTNEIHGGTGGNFLYGGSGATNYVFGGGNDVISDSGGTDQITLPSGITAGDLTFSRVVTGDTADFNDLLITVADGGGSIQIVNQFASSSSDHVETLVFSDSSTLDLTAITGYISVLTQGDDVYNPGINIDQVVYGLNGNDEIITGSGNDTLDGGTGNDLLQGGTGNDTYIASPGFDKISDVGGTAIINIPTGYSLSDLTFSRHIGVSGPDNDLIVDIRGLGEIQVENQFVSSTYAVENLYFVDGSSTVSLTGQVIQTIGTTGNDTLYGLTSGVGGNLFDGRGGSDTYQGGTGDNTFVFATGFGNGTVSIPYHTGNTNTVSFEGVNPANIRMWTDSSGYLHLQDITDTSHSIVVAAGTTGSGTAETAIGTYLEQVKFDDVSNTTWNLTGGLTLTGTSSGETLYGSAYGDTIYSMGGDDTLYGNHGNDTYVIPSSFGNVAIHEALSSGTDTVHLSGIDPSNVVVWTDSSGNLLIQKAGDSSHTITIYGGLSGGNSTVGSYVESVAFDNGTTWDLTSGLILTATNTTSTTLTGTSGNDIITIGTGGGTINAADGNDILNGNTGNDTLNGGNGNDTLTSSAGTDTMNGNAGNDTYSFSSGFGNTTVNESASNGTDAIHFNGINPSNIRMWTTSTGSLMLQDTSDTSHSITVPAGTTGNNTDESTVGGRVESVTFDNGTTWNLTGGLTLTNSSSGGNLFGTAYNDILNGGSGADILYGNAGNDTLMGSAGGDTLYGGPGDDTYSFASGFGNTSVIETTSHGTDAIHFAGIDPANIRMWTTSTGSLLLQDISDTSHTITVTAGLTGNNTDESTIGLYVESVTFDSSYGTTWDLTGGLNLTNSSSGGNLFGTAYNDTLNGGTGNDTLYGNAGNDTLMGSAGTDTLTGGPGNDTYSFASGFGNTTVTETSTGGSDTIHFSGIDPSHIRMWTTSTGALHLQDTSDTSHSITINAGITGSNTDESTIGSYVESVTFDSSYGTTWDLTGGLTLSNDSSGGSLYGTSHDDTLNGGSGADTLYGNAGNDTLMGSAGTDTLTGGPGNDTYSFASGFGNTTVTETSTGGSDTIHFSGIDPSHIRMWTTSTGALHLQDTSDTSHSITINAGITGSNTDESTIGSYVESVTFDSSYGTTWDLTGGLNLTNDSSGGSLYGTSHDDTLNGGSGADTLYGNAGNDTFHGGAGNDAFNGGPGTDTVDFSAAGGAITANISTNSATGEGTDTFNSIENVTGSAYGDTITGDGNANVLNGGAGNDTIVGGAGNDTLLGGAGNDSLDGGTGTNTADFSTAGSGVTVDLSAGTASGDGSDTLTNIQNVTGSSHDDTIVSNSGSNVLDGGAGNDTVSYASAASGVTVNLSTGSATGDGTDTLSHFENVTGSSHDDTITGDSNVNTLSGGSGNDTITGGGGADDLYGGSGADSFLFMATNAFSGVVNIHDFTSGGGNDKIDIKDVISGYDPATMAITDWVQITTVGSDSVVKVDTDGTGSGHTWQQIAVILGVTGLTDEAALVASGNLIAH